jgi:hypothetical protein
MRGDVRSLRMVEELNPDHGRDVDLVGEVNLEIRHGLAGQGIHAPGWPIVSRRTFASAAEALRSKLKVVPLGNFLRCGQPETEA